MTPPNEYAASTASVISTTGISWKSRHVVNEVCVLRYDNEAGKGDHKHVGAVEVPYSFTTTDQLLEDFWNDVDQWRPA